MSRGVCCDVPSGTAKLLLLFFDGRGIPKGEEHKQQAHSGDRHAPLPLYAYVIQLPTSDL